MFLRTLNSDNVPEQFSWLVYWMRILARHVHFYTKLSAIPRTTMNSNSGRKQTCIRICLEVLLCNVLWAESCSILLNLLLVLRLALLELVPIFLPLSHWDCPGARSWPNGWSRHCSLLVCCGLGGHLNLVIHARRLHVLCRATCRRYGSMCLLWWW